MSNYQCPECGNRGEPGFMITEPSAFLVRGRSAGKNVYECGGCGAGLRRCGLFSCTLEKIFNESRTEMERRSDPHHCVGWTIQGECTIMSSGIMSMTRPPLGPGLYTVIVCASSIATNAIQ